MKVPERRYKKLSDKEMEFLKDAPVKPDETDAKSIKDLLDHAPGGSNLISVGSRVYGIGSTFSFKMIEVDKIITRDQVRKSMDPETLALLADDIRDNGLINPLTVRPAGEGKYELIAGHRRFLALKDLLGHKVVPCVVVNIDDEKQRKILQISENIQREELTVMEMAEAVGETFTWIASRHLAVSQSNLRRNDLIEYLRKNFFFKHHDRLDDKAKVIVAEIIDTLKLPATKISTLLFAWSLPEDVKKRFIGNKLLKLEHLKVLLDSGVKDRDAEVWLVRSVENNWSAAELARRLTIERLPLSRNRIAGAKRILKKLDSFSISIKRSKLIKENPDLRQRVISKLRELISELESEETN